MKSLISFHGNPNFVAVFTRGLQCSLFFSPLKSFNASICYLSNINIGNLLPSGDTTTLVKNMTTNY